MTLTYRKIKESDISAFVEMVDCPYVQKAELFVGAQKRKQPYSDVFNMLVKENKEPVFHTFLILRNGEPAGCLCRVRTSAKPGVISIGGWVDKNHRGRGVFGRALKMLIADLQKEYPDHVFSATARNENAPSLKTLRNIGFREIAPVKDQGPKTEFVYP
ncbi:MAG: hypothetical protein COB76_02925 [Alphaproteobacteria bacterium]|nr:MAG: hypothetical protein COB76_02925 [Alphaproteobacteria bacterium]